MAVGHIMKSERVKLILLPQLNRGAISGEQAGSLEMTPTEGFQN